MKLIQYGLRPIEEDEYLGNLWCNFPQKRHHIEPYWRSFLERRWNLTLGHHIVFGENKCLLYWPISCFHIHGHRLILSVWTLQYSVKMSDNYVEELSEDAGKLYITLGITWSVLTWRDSQEQNSSTITYVEHRRTSFCFWLLFWDVCYCSYSLSLDEEEKHWKKMSTRY